MKEFNSVGVSLLKNALKDYFKGLVDEGIYEVDVTCINSEIMQVIDNLPQLPTVPAVPLTDHERTKREMHSEIVSLKKRLAELKAEKSSQNYHDIILNDFMKGVE